MKRQRNFKLSDNIYQMLRDMAADDGTSLTETLETLIISEYKIRNAPAPQAQIKKDTG